jgi:hypothetical protein
MEDRLIKQAKFEMNDSGQHRIVLGNRQSEWATYRGISRLNLSEVKFIAGLSQYYEGILPTEKPLLIEVIQ